MIIDDYRVYRWDFDDFSQMNEAKIESERERAFFLHAWQAILAGDPKPGGRQKTYDLCIFFWLVVLINKYQ